MLSLYLQVVIIFLIGVLAHVSPSFSAVNKGLDASTDYYDDIALSKTFEEFKQKRDADTRRLREQIFAIRPMLMEDRSALAESVLERKIRIKREQEFLKREFIRGVEDLYTKAVARYGTGDHARSRSDFEEIENLAPGYKDTREYLQKLRGATSAAKASDSPARTQIVLNFDPRAEGENK